MNRWRKELNQVGYTCNSWSERANGYTVSPLYVALSGYGHTSLMKSSTLTNHRKVIVSYFVAQSSYPGET